MKLLHVTSPVKVSEDRELFYAQPVTFETFRIAKDFSSPPLSIEQCTVQFDEDREVVPAHIRDLGNLEESIQDIGEFAFKYPFINEILEISYKNSEGYDYLIYSHVDISLMPYFYDSIYEFIKKGYDAIVINRRSITDQYKTIIELPLMWAEMGAPHPGWDCFVFKRDLYPKLNLGKAVIGAVSFGRIMMYNLRYYSKQFFELKDSHLTFHLGFSPTKTKQYTEKNWIKANLHNDEQLEKILHQMIETADGKEIQWVYQELEELKRRRKKYHEGLHGAQRFPGYWKLKKLFGS